ncbi:unnamed protein product, partial [Trichogramma brassicae]
TERLLAMATESVVASSNMLQLICNMKENREKLQTVNRGKNKLSKAKYENIRSESTHVYSRHRDSHASFEVQNKTGYLELVQEKCLISYGSLILHTVMSIGLD